MKKDAQNQLLFFVQWGIYEVKFQQRGGGPRSNGKGEGQSRNLHVLPSHHQPCFQIVWDSPPSCKKNMENL